MCLKRILLNLVLTPLFVQSMVNYYSCKRLKLRGPYTPFFTGHYSIFLWCKMAIKSISCVMNAMTYNKHIRGGNLAVKRRTKLQSTQFKRNLQVSAQGDIFLGSSLRVLMKFFLRFLQPGLLSTTLVVFCTVFKGKEEPCACAGG